MNQSRQEHLQTCRAHGRRAMMAGTSAFEANKPNENAIDTIVNVLLTCDPQDVLTIVAEIIHIYLDETRGAAS